MLQQQGSRANYQVKYKVMEDNFIADGSGYLSWTTLGP